jgi:uncharacterized membrane protein YfcA
VDRRATIDWICYVPDERRRGMNGTIVWKLLVAAFGLIVVGFVAVKLLGAIFSGSLGLLVVVLLIAGGVYMYFKARRAARWAPRRRWRGR